MPMKIGTTVFLKLFPANRSVKENKMEKEVFEQMLKEALKENLSVNVDCTNRYGDGKVITIRINYGSEEISMEEVWIE